MITEARWTYCDMCSRERMGECTCYYFTLLLIPDMDHWNSEKWNRIVVPHYRKYRTAGVILVSGKVKSFYSDILNASNAFEGSN